MDRHFTYRLEHTFGCILDRLDGKRESVDRALEITTDFLIKSRDSFPNLDWLIDLSTHSYEVTMSIHL